MHKTIVASLVAMIASSANASLHPGQIVGRDLDMSKFGFLGHVGLGYWNVNGKADGNLPTNRVIEIHKSDNAKKVITFNSIDNFASLTTFWGAKWGVLESNNMQGVLFSAKDQMKFGAKYNVFPTQTRPGYYDKNHGKVPGNFRCDTFVHWAYKQGGALKKLPLPVITPEYLFNQFPRFNTSLPHNKTIVASEEKSLSDMNIYEFGNYIGSISDKGEEYFQEMLKNLMSI